LQDGLYRVSFETPLGEGAGVVVLREGQILGGDSLRHYAGSYTQTGNRFSATIQVNRDTLSDLGARSVFGREDVQISIQGESGEDDSVAVMAGSSPQVPDVPFRATLVRLR
jgi:hypothetical protein